MLSRARFDELYTTSYRQLRLYVSKLTNGSDNVDDITQEAYTRLLVSAPTGLSDAQLKSYLFATATNIVRDLWRRGTVIGEWLPLDESIETKDSEWEALPLQLDIEKVLTGMSIMQRSLVWLAYAEGYAHKEIAEILNVKEQSVKVLLSRARQKFIELYRALESSSKEGR